MQHLHDELPQSTEALIDWERAIIDQQPDQSVTLDALPFELHQFIRIGRVQLHRMHNLPPHYSHHITRAFGPSGRRTEQPLTFADLIARPEPHDAPMLAIGRRDQTQPKTIGHRRRAFLALLTVEHVLPIWNARYKAGPQVLLALARARRTLIDPHFVLPATWCVYADPDIFSSSDWIYFAAACCVDVVREDIDMWFPMGQVVTTITHAVQSYYHRHPKQQAMVLQFWEWWLMTAIPLAWQQGGQVDG